jgi:glycosyltransferase involved in cell wall biosynthesis
MKVAIVYDRVNKWGGAERTLLAFHELFPEAPLYTSVYDENKASWAKVFPEIIPSFLQKLPVLRQYHELLGWLTPLAYETFNFDDFDCVISVTSEAAKGIITKPKTLHICYCLTPTRYLWSGYDEYLNKPPKPLSWIPFYKQVSQPFLKYARNWDMVAAQRPDIYVAISSEVKKRIRTYYGRDSKILFPPVDAERFKIQDLRFKKKDYYLIVSRLVPYKKVDLAIKAFNELGLPLVIVGTGSEEKKLKEMARSNIKFTGFVKDEDLSEYYQNAKAFIYPQEEDFGITAVEAQAAGIPVIAYKKGGALDTVIDGKTGVLFSSQTKDSLICALNRFNKVREWNKNACVKNSEKFSKERFKSEFKLLIKKFESG